MAALILLVASCGKTEQNPLLSSFDTPHQPAQPSNYGQQTGLQSD